ncbi:PREDICTED: protein OS-9 isoform X7 [Odobenus rosmarus divergens]|uniref:Endoplasmic reticulum lectin n=1 Tax=Odobenus rosmarus divergens TaxID=9708 RepID=A0A2U3W1I4_ODORO|nr:PREDICTED: protein OS-9 isoform X7 [Odobenus rosmarus divergens]
MAAEALLSSLLGLLLLGLLLPASLTGGVGSLNLEELSEMRYGIEILPLPVMGGQSQASDVVIVSSKYKQRYECRLPAGAIHFQREREEEAPAYRGPGIPELLNPMKDAPCLLKTKDWWTYEFCYGRHIQQYHIEDSEIKGEVLYLGYYQSAFDWDDETAKFLCDEGAGVSGDYIDRVDEPLSCSYVLTIRTPRLCPHPLLRPPPSAAPQAILCHPALQPEEYMAYVQRQAVDSKQYGDRVLEELQGPEPHMWSEAQQGAVPSERAGARPAEDDGKESNFWKMLHEPEEQTHGAEEAQAEEQEPNPEVADPAPGPPHDFQNNVQVKVIRSPADLIRLIEELKGGSKKGRPDGGQEQPADDAAEVPHREAEVKGKSDADHQNEVEEEEEEEEEDEDEEEQQLLGEFEKELEGILLPSDRDRLRSEVKAGMERELENIIQETEKELGPDGLQKESERDRAMLALTSTLNKLIKRLEEKQSPELVKKHRKRRVVPKKPPPSPQTAGKIEIKIVRPGAEGTEEDARWLTDEDTRNLKEIFFNILVQGAEEAQKERQRQKELESNYRRVWGSRGGEGTGDLEEFDF